jgi:hypothetical protein
MQESGEGPVEPRARPRKVLITRRSAEASEQRLANPKNAAANDDAIRAMG